MMLFDNAAYHTSESTMNVFKELDLPIIFLGSYSYLMAPIELYWGVFKDADINPENYPTGKSKLNSIIDIFQKTLATSFNWHSADYKKSGRQILL